MPKLSKKNLATLENLSKSFEVKKIKDETSLHKSAWKDEEGLNPFKVVREFIMEKGLKLYGGLALHEHFKKHDDPLYANYEFPDYDVFSPNAWEHAKELCDKLYNLGFYFVEARSSILNDHHHQTYKVSVDMIYILDLTQVGCTNQQLAENDCGSCGLSKDKKCISLFNHIPCFDLKYKLGEQKEYTKTYDYKTNKGVHPNKLFVASYDWLKISMYRELTEPISNPSRLVKVASRLDKFDKYFGYNHGKCDGEVYNKEVKEHFKPILNTIGQFVKKYKLINYGASAYNFFIKNNKENFGSLNVSDYEVYTSLDSRPYGEMLKEILEKKYPDFTFKLQEKMMYWKEIDVDNWVLYGKKGNGRYNNLITFTFVTECMPYLQYDGVKYATLDRLKYLYYRAVSLPKVIQFIEDNPRNYECMLSNLLKLEQKKNKKSIKGKGKFRRFIKQCDIVEGSKIHSNLLKRFGEKIKLTKKTKFYIDQPKKGFITKTYPSPTDDIKFPYKPAETQFKNYQRFYKSLDKYVKTKKYKKRDRDFTTINNTNVL